MDTAPLSAAEITRAQDSSENQRWNELGDREPEIVRESLILAEAHRQASTDPGDAFLAGLKWGEVIFTERERRAAFVEDMQARWSNDEGDVV